MKDDTEPDQSKFRSKIKKVEESHVHQDSY